MIELTKDLFIGSQYDYEEIFKKQEAWL